jgi:hypothetical protein
VPHYSPLRFGCCAATLRALDPDQFFSYPASMPKQTFFIKFELKKRKTGNNMKTKIEKSVITKWTLDPTHSELGLKLRHMMIANVKPNSQSLENLQND